MYANSLNDQFGHAGVDGQGGGFGGGGGDENLGALDEASACDVPMPLADPGTLTTRRAGRGSCAACAGPGAPCSAARSSRRAA